MSQTNGQIETGGQPIPTSEKRELVDTLTKSGFDEEMAENIGDDVVNLLSSDYVLGNVQRKRVRATEFQARNLVRFLRTMYPPEKSRVQGALGAALLDDMAFTREPLSPEQRIALEAQLPNFVFRGSRSVEGWQQERIADQNQTKRLEDNRTEADADDSGGIGATIGNLLSH